MTEIRGEKVTFQRKDIAALHDMPSSQHEDALVVNCPRPRSRIKRICLWVSAVVVAMVMIVAGILIAMEQGALDALLTRQAQTSINKALGERYRTVIGATVIRMSPNYGLALEAHDVITVDNASGMEISRAGSIRLALDARALLTGRIAVAHVEAEGISVDTGLLPSGDKVDFSRVRVDQMPLAVEAVFSQLDLVRGLVERGRTDSVSIAGLAMRFPGENGTSIPVEINRLDLARAADGTLSLAGLVTVDGTATEVNISATGREGKTESVSATLGKVALTSFTIKRDATGAPWQGLDSNVSLSFSATRASGAAPASLKADLSLSPGAFYMSGIRQDVGASTVGMAYDFDKSKVEILRSSLLFGGTSLPFTGAVIDLDQIDPAAPRGFGLDLLVRNGVASASSSGEPPITYDAKLSGRFLPETGDLVFDEAGVVTPQDGAMHGSLKLRFAETGSPEISFGSRAQTLSASAVKQLWPFWMAAKARQWVLANMFGGTVTNGTIAVFIPAGRMLGDGTPLHLGDDELVMSFDIADTRINVTGDVPPLRDVTARFDLKGQRIAVHVSKGASFFPSGRSVTLGEGDFVIPAVYDKPLLADMDLALSGNADAVAELLTFRPVKVLERAGLEPQDLTGAVTASIKARFGLIKAQNPPAPIWDAKVALSDVDLKKPYAGRSITAVNGNLSVDNEQLVLEAKAAVDTVPVEMKITEPVGAGSAVKRERVITATLSDDNRSKFAPGLDSIASGPVGIELTLQDDKTQSVSADLGKTTISVPWIGWTKSAGVPARATFVVDGQGKDLTIRDFSLTGDGFGASGQIALAGGSLSSATFANVRLSSADSYGLKITRGKSGYDIALDGKSADLRSVLKRVKSNGGTGSSGDKGTAIRLKASLDRVVGFNDESLRNVDLSYQAQGSRITGLDLSATTESGQAVIGTLDRSGDSNLMRLTSGDAGAIARFSDLYKRMQGGLLNLSFRNGSGDAWTGSIDVRNFRVANEKALQSIVSTPVGEKGRSLNAAVKRDIDVSSERFQRGFARLVSSSGVLSVENGVLRGEQVGATFKGILKDSDGNMDMTGTFMPAYGLNRLFAELPFIGVLLGNGRDRGLLGITFRLKGSMASPVLTINPLSIIAPGIFRQIFEFQ